MKNTSEFSFVLKPSAHGVGVFAAHNIQNGAHLRLFGDNDTSNLGPTTRIKKDVPEQFHEYCMDRGETLFCPKDFGCMHVGWYLNHSKNPNALRDVNFNWYASRDIHSGEEIVIDYNSLEEPTEAKDAYYNL